MENKEKHGLVDRFLGGADARTKILEALDELKKRGTSEATSYEIAKMIKELHPPKRWWDIGLMSHGKIFRALDMLKEEGEIADRAAQLLPKNSKDTGRRWYYHRVERSP